MQAGHSSRRCVHAQQRTSRLLHACRIHAPAAAPRLCRRGSRRPAVAVAAKQNLYEVLGVPQTATDKEIKKAYRQKALKLHPDVNKAPDAEVRFMEAKNAFAILGDAKERAEYDRRLRMGSGSWGDFSGWGSTSSTTGAGAGARRPQQQEEDFYSLDDLLKDAGSKVSDFVQQVDWSRVQDVPNGVAGWVQQQGERLRTKGIADFFKDLDKELNDWTQSKEKDGKPLGLWEELAGIGEELVDYLEDSLGIKEAEAAAKKASGSSSSSDRPKSAVDQYEELLRNLNMESKGTDGSKSSSSSGGSQQQANRASQGSSNGQQQQQQQQQQRRPDPPPQKTADEEIDDMLAALKKKHNK